MEKRTCTFYLKRKKRNCRMEATSWSRYCGEHSVLENLPVRQHVCPLDTVRCSFMTNLLTSSCCISRRSKETSQLSVLEEYRVLLILPSKLLIACASVMSLVIGFFTSKEQYLNCMSIFYFKIHVIYLSCCYCPVHVLSTSSPLGEV